MQIFPPEFIATILMCMVGAAFVFRMATLERRGLLRLGTDRARARLIQRDGDENIS